jgi:hypothetical protein
MNETMSLVLATTILAMGGLGLYMYKNSDESSFEDYDENNENEYNDDLSVTEDDLSQDDIDDEIEEYYDDEYDEPKPKARSKTKRSKKSGGTRKKH